MSKFKNSILRELGIKESSIKPSEVNHNAFPGIDPEEQDGNMEDPSDLLSPTAVPVPVIALAVRGSNTGGLPSGRNLSTSKLGGYEPVSTAKQNSLIVNKTPKSGRITNPEPIAKDENPDSPDGEHPHQVQNAADQPPQAVTGAAIDDSSLQLKATLPQGVDVDVAEGDDEENHADNPEFQEKDQDQFRKDRSDSPDGDEVRKHLGMNEEKESSNKCFLCGGPISKKTPDEKAKYHKDGKPVCSQACASVDKKDAKMNEETEGSLQLKDALPQSINEGKHKSGCKCGFCMNKNRFGKKSEDSKENDKEDVDEQKIPMKRLYAVRQSLQEKAIAGTMSKKESEVFRCITEILQKRGEGLEQKLFGKKSMLETAGVVSERELPHEEVLAAWEDDSSSGDYIGVNDNGDAYYQGKLIVPAEREKEMVPGKAGSPPEWKMGARTMNPDWKGIQAWCNQHNYWPNVWVSNDHGNVELYTVNGKPLGGLV